MTHRLGSRLTLEQLEAAAATPQRLFLDRAAVRRMDRARKLVLERSAGQPLYGVNTGFGELANRRITVDQLRTLQRNLVLSHACGVGEPLSEAESRAIVFLRANELARGRSGVRPALVRLMAALLQNGLTPVVPSRGSVGASGDLAPLAHAALPLIGEGEVWKRGRRLPSRKALAASRLKPLVLDVKEGLSLVNGTQAMQAVGGLALAQAYRVLRAADLAGAMSLEALKGTPAPFDALISDAKPHAGQVETAAILRRLLAGSEIRRSHLKDDPRVQDPYSLRCMPQVHGAVRGALAYARGVVETEMASATDNPLVFSEAGRILSGGNFHGQALALAFDHAALALTALGNIAERRIFQLVSDATGILPPFLARDPGLESGWMIAQVVAASLASENKSLAHPASADSITTSWNKEDHVSMGMGAALKLKQILRNTRTIVAIELLAAAEGLDFHAPLKPGRGVAAGAAKVRRLVPAAKGDRPLSGGFEKVGAAIGSGVFE